MIPDIDKHAKEIQDAIEALRRLLAKLLGLPRVLVVEDNESDLFLLMRELKKFQCTVMVAKDGEEAVTLIKATQFDIILLDQGIPKLTGGEILAATAGWRPNSRVVVVTGYLHSPCIPKTLEKGAVMAFAKPVTADVLKLFLTPV